VLVLEVAPFLNSQAFKQPLFAPALGGLLGDVFEIVDHNPVLIEIFKEVVFVRSELGKNALCLNSLGRFNLFFQVPAFLVKLVSAVELRLLLLELLLEALLKVLRPLTGPVENARILQYKRL
jgi:hypothetical protein